MTMKDLTIKVTQRWFNDISRSKYRRNLKSEIGKLKRRRTALIKRYITHILKPIAGKVKVRIYETNLGVMVIEVYIDDKCFTFDPANKDALELSYYSSELESNIRFYIKQLFSGFVPDNIEVRVKSLG